MTVELLRLTRSCLVDQDLNVRVQASRAARYLVWDPAVLESEVQLRIPDFLCRALLRADSRYQHERLRALRWVKHVIEVDAKLIPRCVGMTLVAICNEKGDIYQRPCLETLRDLAITNVQLVCECNGIRTLVLSILDPKLSALSTSLTLTLLYILNHPSTRQFIRPNEDIQHLLALFTDTSPSDTGATREREVAHRALLTMFRSWSGSIYLGSKGLKSLVDLASLPENIHQVAWTRRCLFHILNEILTPCLTTMEHTCWRGPNFLVNYVVLILAAFIENGIIEALSTVGLFSDPKISTPARKLLNRIQQIGSRYLPPHLTEKITDLKEVVQSALTNVGVAGAMVSDLCERDHVNLEENFEFDDVTSKYVSKNLNTQSINVMFLCPETDINSGVIRYRYILDSRHMINQELKNMRDSLTPYFNHRDAIETKKLLTFSETVVSHIREHHTHDISKEIFDQMLKSTNVLATKECEEWNLNATWNLLNGVLWGDHWFSKALNTRFFKRWLNFLKPSKQQFCLIKWNTQTMKYARIACQLFRLFTSKSDGVGYSIFNELIQEIVSSLKEQIAANERSDRQDPANPFSRYSVHHTLSCMYFHMIGILTESESGMVLFNKCQISHLLLKVSNDMRKRYGKTFQCSPNDYLLGKLLCSFDYVQERDTRVLFTQFLTQASTNLRKILLSNLHMLFRCQVPEIAQWGIHLLYLQIKLTGQQQDVIVRQAARVLEWVCTSEETSYGDETLEEAIRCGLQPDDMHIGVLGVRMLSCPSGFERAKNSKTNWLEKERKAWMEYKNVKWLQEQEKAVLQATSIIDTSNQSDTHFLINDTSGTEEDLQYLEQLFWLPWKLEVTVIYPSSRNEVQLPVDCYFDYDMCVENGSTTKHMGCGVVATITDSRGMGKPFPIDDNAAIIVRVSVSEDSLDDFFARKTRQRIGRLHERKKVGEGSSVINKDGVVWVFDEGQKKNTSLTKVLFTLDVQDYSNALVRPLPHFYNQIAQTAAGAQYMVESGDVKILVNFVRENIDPGMSEKLALKLRAALWALGMFGSSEHGFEILDKMNFVQEVAHHTVHSPVLSVKGTCMYIMGLFSRSVLGEKRIQELGFWVPPDNLEHDLGVAIPRDLKTFFRCTEPSNEFQKSFPLKQANAYGVDSDPKIVQPLNMREKPPTTAELIGDPEFIEETCVAHLSALCNIVTLKSSMKALRKIKQKCAPAFKVQSLFQSTMDLMDTYNFNLGARRFMFFELFPNMPSESFLATWEEQELKKEDVKKGEILPRRRNQSGSSLAFAL